MKAHAAVAAELLGSEELVWSALEDPDNSPLKPEEKVLLRFIDKVNAESPHIGPQDIEPLHAAGWTDEAIYFAITVCALFNFYNRWVDAAGVHPMSEEAHRDGGKRMALQGYVRK